MAVCCVEYTPEIWATPSIKLDKYCYLSNNIDNELSDNKQLLPIFYYQYFRKVISALFNRRNYESK